jgi:ankyrin repeat protein
MIETPEQTESNNNSSTNKKNISENSDNNIKIDYSLPKLPLPNIKIEEDNLSSGTEDQFYPIHNSILSDNLEELEKLLKLGENPDLFNKSGETALYLSVDIENYDALIILLEFGADSNVQKEDGSTPLHLAAEKKLDIYVCSLLSHGANPNIINKTNSQCPMHIAIINRMNEYVLNKFKENNGDIYNIKDKFNKSPIDYATKDEKYKNLLISIFTKNNIKENNYIIKIEV